MNNQIAYNSWAQIYDSMPNKTRDLEKKAFEYHTQNLQFTKALELGCGTGKNTVALSQKSKELYCLDFSEEMVKWAKEKNQFPHIHFLHRDLTLDWDLESKDFDFISCSLVLEHIQDLNFIFAQAARHTRDKAYFYLGEYHPFKQYEGKKARFETESGSHELECYPHHLSEYIQSGRKNGFVCVDLQEWFDRDDTLKTPRILSILFQKQ